MKIYTNEFILPACACVPTGFGLSIRGVGVASIASR